MPSLGFSATKADLLCLNCTPTTVLPSGDHTGFAIVFFTGPLRMGLIWVKVFERNKGVVHLKKKTTYFSVVPANLMILNEPAAE